ncbi:MAG: acyltransferase [Bacteroidaceae bacterium]|nr:acyltransferase [Bacteroidaceae bacterium]
MIGKKERDFSLDVLRVLACFFVILLHVGVFYYQTKDDSNHVVIVRDSSAYVVGYLVSWCRAAVPLFILISGFFLLPVKIPVTDFFSRRFSRILYPFLFWCVVYALYHAVMNRDSLAQFFTNIMMIPVNYGTRIGHLWYVYTLSGLYLLAPIISPWLENVSKKFLRAYLGFWFLTTFVPYVHLFWPNIWGEAFWNENPMHYYFSGFIGYFVLGFYFKKYGAPSLKYSLPMFIAGYAATAYLFNMRIPTATSVPDLELGWLPCTPNVAIMTIGLFGLVRSVNWNGKGLFGRIVSEFAAKSYAIFLVHMMIVREIMLLAGSYISSAIVGIPVYSAAVMLISYVVVAMLARLPNSSKWLGV